MKLQEMPYTLYEQVKSHLSLNPSWPDQLLFSVWSYLKSRGKNDKSLQNVKQLKIETVKLILEKVTEKLGGNIALGWNTALPQVCSLLKYMISLSPIRKQF